MICFYLYNDLLTPFLQVKEVDEEVSLTLLEIFVTFVLAIFFSQDK